MWKQLSKLTSSAGKAISLRQVIGAVIRFGRAREGASAVELAICFPLIAGLIIPVIDLGMGAYTQMQVANAAQAGAEYAAVRGFNIANIVNTVASATNLPGIQPNPNQLVSGVFTPTPAPSQSCSCISGTAIVPALPAGSPPCSQTCPNGNVGIFVTVTAQASYATLFSYPGIPSPLTLTAQSIIRVK
jgi:hypothetical protein